MKIQLFILVYILTLSLVFSQGQEKKEAKVYPTNKSTELGNTINAEIRKDTIKDLDIKSMKKLLDKEYELIDSNKPTDFKSIQWVNYEIFKTLLKNGYKIPISEEFQLKMQSVFGINMKIKQTCKWNKVGNEYIIIHGKQYIEDEKRGFNNELRSEFFESVYTGNILFFSNKQFMSFIISPVRIVNFSEDSLSYKVKIPQYVISRNKYLFNDDPSQFSWLINNDSEFMRSLVTYFGYTEDRKLLKWVIDNTDLDFYTLRANGLLNFNEFGSLFWNKNCDGKLKLHPNTFKMFQELYKPNDNTTMRFLLYDIAGYLDYLFDKDNYKGILTEDDKVKIGANLVYFAEQYKYNPEFKDSNRMMGRFRYFTSEDYDGIIKKNNYYNLPKFREWWDKAEYDEDFVRECEYDGTCGRDNPQPDPINPKYKNSF